MHALETLIQPHVALVLIIVSAAAVWAVKKGLKEKS